MKGLRVFEDLRTVEGYREGRPSWARSLHHLALLVTEEGRSLVLLVPWDCYPGETGGKLASWR